MRCFLILHTLILKLDFHNRNVESQKGMRDIRVKRLFKIKKWSACIYKSLIWTNTAIYRRIFDFKKTNKAYGKSYNWDSLHVEVAWWINIFAKAKQVLKIFIEMKNFWRSMLNIKTKRSRKTSNYTETKVNGDFQEKSKNCKKCKMPVLTF